MLKFISVNFEIIGGILVAILDIKKAGELVFKNNKLNQLKELIKQSVLYLMIWQKLCIKLMV